MALTAEEIKKGIIDHIVERHSIEPSEIDETVNLWEEGILDSLDIQDFISFLEEKFDIEVEQRHLRDKRFFSVQGLSQLITELKAG